MINLPKTGKLLYPQFTKIRLLQGSASLQLDQIHLKFFELSYGRSHLRFSKVNNSSTWKLSSWMPINCHHICVSLSSHIHPHTHRPTHTHIYICIYIYNKREGEIKNGRKKERKKRRKERKRLKNHAFRSICSMAKSSSVGARPCHQSQSAVSGRLCY